MRTLAELSAFAAMALAAHVVFWPATDFTGVEGSGAEGEALLSIAASSAHIEQLVDEWETPPEVAAPVMMAAAEITDAAPDLPDLPDLSPTRPTPIIQGSRPMPPDALPQVEPPAPRELAGLPAASIPEIAPDRDGNPLTPEQSRRPPTPPERKAAPPPEKNTVRAQKKPAQEKSAEAAPGKKPAKASAASNARKAQGEGGGTAKGKTKKSRAATLSKSVKTSLIRQWGSQIRSRIQRRAPRGVGRGRAVVTITVSGSGALLGVRLQQSSGNARLDKLAVAAVRQAGRFPAAPKRLGIGKHTFRLPINSR